MEAGAAGHGSGLPAAKAGQFVTFGCAGRHLAVDIMTVREIRNWMPTTTLPGEPPEAAGVLDIRGSIVQVLDLAVVLYGEMPSHDQRTDQMVLVVSLAGRDLGLVVDKVSDIVAPEANAVLAPPASTGVSAAASSVVGLLRHEDRLITVLDLERLFPDPAAEWVTLD